MKTNPLTSKLRNLYLLMRKHRKMSGCAPVYPDKSGTRRGFLFTIAAILLLLLLPRCHHQQRKPPHARQQLPRLCTTHRDPRYHNLRCAIYRIPITHHPHLRPQNHHPRHRLHRPHRHPHPHTNYHQTTKVHPTFLPLLHHFICFICFICYISI